MAEFCIPDVPYIRERVENLPLLEIAGTCHSMESCLIARVANALNPGWSFEVAPSTDKDYGPGSITGYSHEGRVVIDRLPDDMNTLALRFDGLDDGSTDATPDDADQYYEAIDSEGRDVTAAEVLARWDELTA